MVFTGDQLIYGVQLTLDEAIKYIQIYMKKHDEETYKKIKYDIKNDDVLKDNINEKYWYLNEIVSDLDLSIQLLKPPCCFFDESDEDFDKVYFGVVLTSNQIISRYEIYKFNNFDEYNDFYTSGINEAKNKLEENKELYIQDLEKLLPKSKVKPKFYSLPNDCYTCS